MALYLIRNAKAGHKRPTEPNDHLRTLTTRGEAQAAAIADWLSAIPVTEILSSPYTRCVQTVEPLARRHGLQVQHVDALLPRADHIAALELLRILPDHSVLCSHGNLIPAVIELLVRQGTEQEGPANWRKGSVWVLERDGDRLATARTMPPQQYSGVIEPWEYPRSHTD